MSPAEWMVTQVNIEANVVTYKCANCGSRNRVDTHSPLGLSDGSGLACSTDCRERWGFAVHGIQPMKMADED